MNKIELLNKVLEQKKLLKVIAGLDNFDKDNVKNIVLAALAGKACSVDIAADVELIEWVTGFDNLITFVSSLDISKLVLASKHGADVLEIGNYDVIYNKNQTVTKEQVLAWTRELYAKVQGKSLICTTIPCKLSLEEQINLATQLQAAGANILQIENLGDEKEAYYFECAKEIVKVVEIPTILSGRLNNANILKALATGVNGVGVGKFITSKQVDKMTDTVANLVNTIENKVLINI